MAGENAAHLMFLNVFGQHHHAMIKEADGERILNEFAEIRKTLRFVQAGPVMTMLPPEGGALITLPLSDGGELVLDTVFVYAMWVQTDEERIATRQREAVFERNVEIAVQNAIGAKTGFVTG